MLEPHCLLEHLNLKSFFLWKNIKVPQCLSKSKFLSFMTELISIIGILTLGDYYNDINVSVCQWLKKKFSIYHFTVFNSKFQTSFSHLTARLAHFSRYFVSAAKQKCVGISADFFLLHIWGNSVRQSEEQNWRKR